MEKNESKKDDKIEKIIRCEECKLIPLINFYIKDYGFSLELKCRNNHEKEQDLSKYLENNLSDQLKNPKDATCSKHNKEITSICKYCQKNFCEKCVTKECKKCKIQKINDFSLTKEEKENINKNIDNYENFVKKLRKVVKVGIGFSKGIDISSLKEDLDYFIETNNALFKLAKIIYQTYVENEDNLCYEIIQNCRKCLNFNYQELSLNGYSGEEEESFDRHKYFSSYYCTNSDYSEIDNYLSSKDNYILSPKEEEINLSNIKVLNDMEFWSETNEDSFYRRITELKDGRPVLSTDEKVDILKNNSLTVDFSITPEIKVIEEARYYGLFLGDILGLSNGDLIIVTGECIIYVYEINKNEYKLKHTIKEEGLIFNVIELHDKTIIAFKHHKIVQYKLTDNKYKKIKELKNEKIPKGSSFAVLKEFKDYSKILLSSEDTLLYFDMNGNFEKKLKIKSFPKWDFLGNDYLLQGFGDIYIRDIKTLKEISYKQCGEDDVEVECLCELKDGSFLCGISNRFGCYLKQYAFKGRTIKEIYKCSFESYKEDFENIYQLKNGNIIGSISTGEYFLFMNK